MKTRWLVTVLGLLFLLWIGGVPPHTLKGQNDFSSFYTGAALIGSGELYSPSANVSFQRATLGVAPPPGLYYCRPPFHAALLRPLAWLPYQTAYRIFQGLSLSAFLWFAWRFTKELPHLPVLCAWSIPILVTIFNGQDAFLVTAAAAGAVLLRRAGRPFLAGLLLSLCAAKFHLFLFVPVALFFCREWRMLGGGAAGGAVLTAVSFATAGWRWPLDYARMLTNPAINPRGAYPMNLRALVFDLTGHDSALVVVLWSLPVVAAVVYALWKAKESLTIEISLGVALLAGLLLSHHAFVYDGSLLLLVLVLFRGCGAVGRCLATLAVLPPLYLLASFGAPYSAALPVCLLGLLAFMTAGMATSRAGVRGFQPAQVTLASAP